MSRFGNLSLVKALEKVSQKQLSCLQLAEDHLHSLSSNLPLNCFLSLQPIAEILESARQADILRSQGCPRGHLDGIAIAVKDNFATRDLPTTCASRMLKDFSPPYDATLVDLLRQQGAIIIGKTNLDEFAMGSSNTHSFFGPALNPHNQKHVAGGSSGGSAVAVASGACLGALGSDTGGSVRLPASYTGIVGMKPTYGTLSRWGLIAYSSSLDTPGFLVKAVEDAELLFGLLAGHDKKDPTSLVSSHAPSPAPKHKLRVGIPREYLLQEMDSEILEIWSRALSTLDKAGFEIKTVSLPHTRDALPAYYILASSEASSNLARYDGIRYGHRDVNNLGDDFRSTTRAAGFGAEVQRRILMGTLSLSASSFESYYRQAQKVRRLVKDDFDQAFGEVDVLLTPTARSTAPTLESELGSTTISDSSTQHHGGSQTVRAYLNDVFTVPSSLAGLPAMSIPAGKGANQLPLGLQLIAPRLQEQRLFQVGKILQPRVE